MVKKTNVEGGKVLAQKRTSSGDPLEGAVGFPFDRGKASHTRNRNESKVGSSRQEGKWKPKDLRGGARAKSKPGSSTGGIPFTRLEGTAEFRRTGKIGGVEKTKGLQWDFSVKD